MFLHPNIAHLFCFEHWGFVPVVEFQLNRAEDTSVVQFEVELFEFEVRFLFHLLHYDGVRVDTCVGVLFVAEFYQGWR